MHSWCHTEVVEEILCHRFNTKYKKNLDGLAKLLEEKEDYSRNYVRRIRWSQLDNWNSNGILKNRYQLPQLKDFCKSISYLATEQPGNHFSTRHMRKTDYCGVNITDIGPRKIGKGNIYRRMPNSVAPCKERVRKTTKTCQIQGEICHYNNET